MSRLTKALGRLGGIGSLFWRRLGANRNWHGRFCGGGEPRTSHARAAPVHATAQC